MRERLGCPGSPIKDLRAKLEQRKKNNETWSRRPSQGEATGNQGKTPRNWSKMAALQPEPKQGMPNIEPQGVSGASPGSGRDAETSDNYEVTSTQPRNTVRRVRKRLRKSAPRTNTRSVSPEVEIILEHTRPPPPSRPAEAQTPFTYVGRVFCPTCTAANGYQDWPYEVELKMIIGEAQEALIALYRQRETTPAPEADDEDDDVVELSVSPVDMVFTEPEAEGEEEPEVTEEVEVVEVVEVD